PRRHSLLQSLSGQGGIFRPRLCAARRCQIHGSLCPVPPPVLGRHDRKFRCLGIPYEAHRKDPRPIGAGQMIYIVIFLVAVALFIKAFTLRHVLDNVTYSIKSEKSVVEPGESFSVTTTLKNGKGMPVMFIRLEELIPTKMQVEGASQQFYAMNDKSRL